jgi:peptide/nickel transport system permease protein
MASYIFRRLIQSIPILIGIAIISFLIVHAAPGSPIDRFRSGRVSPETIRNLIRLYGLDQPLLPIWVENGLSLLIAILLMALAGLFAWLFLRAQRGGRRGFWVNARGAVSLLLMGGSLYLIFSTASEWQLLVTWPGQLINWMLAFVQVWRPDAWGYSFTDGQPVIQKIADRVPYTLELMGTALVLTVIIAIPVGILGAVKQYSWSDKIIMVLATIGYAMPTFWLGLVLKYIFAFQLDVFPLFGRHEFGEEGLPDLIWHMVLPVLTLTIVSVAGWSRYMRSSMLEVMRQDYVRTAKAKGLQTSRVLYKHALRNALIPIVTLLGLTIPTLLVGAAVTEAVYSWPGLGSMGVTAVTERDYPLVLAFVMVGGTMVILGNLLADVLYAFVDPRIKY